MSDNPHQLVEVPIQARWRDMDALAHVNNAVYLTYFEEARLAWFDRLTGDWYDDKTTPVLASITCNFRRPLSAPAELRSAMYLERRGRSSLTVSYEVHDIEGNVYADGSSVIVWIDRQTNSSIPLPASVTDALPTD